MLCRMLCRVLNKDILLYMIIIIIIIIIILLLLLLLSLSWANSAWRKG